jgi:CheY-like chemotaxis protein
MQDGPRILVAAALAKIIEPLLRQSMIDAKVRIAEDEAAVQDAINDRLRFDVVVADLTWNDYAVEYSFDGLDVLNALRHAGRQTPVIFAAQGHGLERDHLDEAVEQPEVAGIYRKATGPGPLIEAIDITVSGGSLAASRFPPGASPPDIPRIHAYFKKGKGTTAARLAGAIASGRAVNHETLASAAHVGYDTAAKLVDYLGPLIKDRHGSPRQWCHEPPRLRLMPKAQLITAGAPPTATGRWRILAAWLGARGWSMQVLARAKYDLARICLIARQWSLLLIFHR